MYTGGSEMKVFVWAVFLFLLWGVYTRRSTSIAPMQLSCVRIGDNEENIPVALRSWWQEGRPEGRWVPSKELAAYAD